MCKNICLCQVALVSSAWLFKTNKLTAFRMGEFDSHPQGNEASTFDEKVEKRVVHC